MNQAMRSVLTMLVIGELLIRAMRDDPHRPVLISLTAAEPMTDLDEAIYGGMDDHG